MKVARGSGRVPTTDCRVPNQPFTVGFRVRLPAGGRPLGYSLSGNSSKLHSLYPWTLSVRQWIVAIDGPAAIMTGERGRFGRRATGRSRDRTSPSSILPPPRRIASRSNSNRWPLGSIRRVGRVVRLAADGDDRREPPCFADVRRLRDNDGGTRGRHRGTSVGGYGFDVTYRVSCPVCDLERTMGELDDVLDLQDAHQAQSHDGHVLESTYASASSSR